jgi:hypothetical protein
MLSTICDGRCRLRRRHDVLPAPVRQFAACGCCHLAFWTRPLLAAGSRPALRAVAVRRAHFTPGVTRPSPAAIKRSLNRRPPARARHGADGFLAGAKGSQWTFIPRKQST